MFWWQGQSFVEFHMPWVCTLDFLVDADESLLKIHIVDVQLPLPCSVQWCCTEWRSGPCILLFKNVLALIWVTGPLLQRFVRWWAWLVSCCGQTEGWLLSSCWSCSVLLRNRHNDTLHPVIRWLFLLPYCCKEELKNLCRKLWLCVETLLSRGFSVFEGSRGCHNFFFLWHLSQYQDPGRLLQLLMVVCSELRWNVLPILPPALLLWWKAFPVYQRVGSPRYLPLTNLAIWYVLVLPCWQPHVLDLPGLPCNPAFLPFSSSSLSGLRISNTACISFSLSDLVSMTFFFRDLLLSMACQVSAVIHSFAFLSASQAGFADVCRGYSDLLPHGVDVARGGQCLFFWASASPWNFFFSWRVKVLSGLGSFSFLHQTTVVFPWGLFLLSFSSRVALTR